MEKIGEEFFKKHGCDPRKNDKTRLRMIEAIEKARVNLSSVPDANINVEYLMEEQDLMRNLKRDEFESLCDNQTRHFHKLLTETIELSGLNTD